MSSWDGTVTIILRNNTSPWKRLLCAHYCSATIDAKAGRIWALCVPCDTCDYVTVKGISIPLTLSEKLASPRKPKTTSEEIEKERFLNPTKTKPKRFQNLTFHHRLFERDWFHIFQETQRRLNENSYSSFEPTMEKITDNEKAVV